MKRLLKIVSALLLVALVCSVAAPAVFASEAGATTATTAPTTAAAQTKLELKALSSVGSNQKNYLCSPNYSNSTDNYSFNVPDWMPSLTVKITGPSGLSCSSSSVSFSESNGVYSGTFELKEKTQSFSVKFSSNSGQSRTLNITVRRSTIECFFDKVILRLGDNEIAPKSGSVNDGLVYELASGTKSCEFRLTPRHENEVFFENTTVRADGTRVVDAANAKEKQTLEYYRYTIKPDLIEGTNTFVATITAGSVTKTCNITVIVGDPNANSAAGTTTTSAISSIPPVSGQQTVTDYGCSINGTTMTLTNASTGVTQTYYRSDGTAADSIYGTWSASDGSGTMVFYADNTCLVNGTSCGYTLNGTALRIESFTMTSPSEDTGTVLPTTTQAKQSGGLLGGMSPLMWVLIGIIITVVLGACIFMIVNMSSSGSKNRMPEDDYYDEPLYRDSRRGRNLADFAGDDYGDYDDYDRGYGGRNRPYQGRQRNVSFDEYDDDDYYGRY
ncbi:MAG: hypothetical protein IJP10_04445 [Clostridia bacterium]|nr:hypothetical protein [Clostridia bacterium]